RAFLHGDIDGDPIIRQLRDFGVDLDAVVTIGIVLPLKFLHQLIQQRAPEQLATGQSLFLQGFLELVATDLLVALDAQTRNLRAFLDLDQQRVTAARQADILEQTGLIQRANRLLCTLWRELIADPPRQIGQHRAGLQALYALDLYVVNTKAALPPCVDRKQKHKNSTNIQSVSPHNLIQTSAGCRCKKPAPSIPARPACRPAGPWLASLPITVAPEPTRSHNTADGRHPTLEWAVN